MEYPLHIISYIIGWHSIVGYSVVGYSSQIWTEYPLHITSYIIKWYSIAGYSVVGYSIVGYSRRWVLRMLGIPYSCRWGFQTMGIPAVGYSFVGYSNQIWTEYPLHIISYIIKWYSIVGYSIVRYSRRWVLPMLGILYSYRWAFPPLGIPLLGIPVILPGIPNDQNNQLFC